MVDTIDGAAGQPSGSDSASLDEFHDDTGAIEIIVTGDTQPGADAVPAQEAADPDDDPPDSPEPNRGDDPIEKEIADVQKPKIKDRMRKYAAEAYEANRQREAIAAERDQIAQAFYAEQARGIFPALDEVRLQIRDSAPEDNHMMRDQEYDLAEICFSMIEALHAYNTAPPPINSYLFTNTFSMQADIMGGMLATLYQMSWEHRARNRLAYASGGVTVDDHWNYELYLKMAEDYKAKYALWIKKTKKALNSLLGWSSSGIRPCGSC